MKEESVLGVNLDVCPKCAGIWCDAGELNGLLARDPIAFARVDAMVVPHVEERAGPPSALLCPDCLVRLQSYHYMYNSPVVLDACTTCGGFWIEDGELSKMQQVLNESQGVPSAKERAGMAVGMAAGEHMEEMMRLDNIRTFFMALNQRSPGWIL